MNTFSAMIAFAASASAFQAPMGTMSASRSAVRMQATYDPSDFSDVQNLPGIIAPTGFFDPLSLSEGVSESELKRYREAELTHGRVAMLASLGFFVGESGFHPLFDGKIDGIAINQFWQVPLGFWPVIGLFIAVPETFRALRGWMEPTVKENYFQLRPGYIPGDLDFDPAGFKPTDMEELKLMQTKELQHGRVAMLASFAFVFQELISQKSVFQYTNDFMAGGGF